MKTIYTFSGQPAKRNYTVADLLPVAIIAFLFSMFTIYGAGANATMWGFLLLLSGIPVYVIIRVRRHKGQDTQGLN